MKEKVCTTYYYSVYLLKTVALLPKSPSNFSLRFVLVKIFSTSSFFITFQWKMICFGGFEKRIVKK